ncbi:PREDICTED: negative elongation factor E [Lepidothrix coronata]|uniref:Negative elongation factor E n=1 Tax=Lepidothrix coronata TaxID=321398 RepID=A0A6J0GC22_9PASS|nr:PREDICTED: negative elongation factor E [Lepidothrix coronata]
MHSVGVARPDHTHPPPLSPSFSCAFVTYEKMESADQAIAELNGAVVQDVQLKVSIARKQPLLDAATGKSLWGSLAVKNSAKGSHRDKRSQVVYNEDLFGGQ